MVHWARFALGIRLPGLPLTVPGWYIPLTGGVWGLAGLAFAFGLFTGRPWAMNAVLWGSIVYTGWYWADRLLFVRSDYARSTRPASIALTALGLGAVWLIMRRRDVRQYFGRRVDDRSIEDR